MSLILNIDTATDNASICVALNGNCIGLMENAGQKDHAAWLHIAIENLIKNTGCNLHELKAIAVTAGPGSYTGLRIGMASAKGFCHALNIPLITENTLKVMAYAALRQFNNSAIQQLNPSIVLCPMLDARRMEVFTALYKTDLTEVVPPMAIVLNETSFKENLESSPIYFFGNGSNKWGSICQHANAKFINASFNASHLAELSQQKFHQSDFAELAYAEPLYLKEFYTPAKK